MYIHIPNYFGIQNNIDRSGLKSFKINDFQNTLPLFKAILSQIVVSRIFNKIIDFQNTFEKWQFLAIFYLFKNHKLTAQNKIPNPGINEESMTYMQPSKVFWMSLISLKKSFRSHDKLLLLLSIYLFLMRVILDKNNHVTNVVSKPMILNANQCLTHLF